jgi:hypothetical protein
MRILSSFAEDCPPVTFHIRSSTSAQHRFDVHEKRGFHQVRRTEPSGQVNLLNSGAGIAGRWCDGLGSKLFRPNCSLLGRKTVQQSVSSHCITLSKGIDLYVLCRPPVLPWCALAFSANHAEWPKPLAIKCASAGVSGQSHFAECGSGNARTAGGPYAALGNAGEPCSRKRRLDS